MNELTEDIRFTNINELPYPQSPGSVGFLWGPIVTKRKNNLLVNQL